MVKSLKDARERIRLAMMPPQAQGSNLSPAIQNMRQGARLLSPKGQARIGQAR